jgi:predicted transposase YdaD
MCIYIYEINKRSKWVQDSFEGREGGSQEGREGGSQEGRKRTCKHSAQALSKATFQ